MVNQVADLQEQVNWHWRNTMRPVRFFNFDAKAAIPFCFLLFYFRVSTIVFAALVMTIFYLLEKRGLTFDAAMRATRLFIFGDFRPALVSFKRRRLRDYG
jgi:intracellular multiplication protein IcmT